MRARTIGLTVVGALLGAVLLGASPLAAQGCSGCTGSHSCGVSSDRSLCSWECSLKSGVCACADARCPPIIRPDAMLSNGAEAVLLAAATGLVRVDSFLVTRCDGSREVFARVATPYGGVGLLSLGRPATWTGMAVKTPELEPEDVRHRAGAGADMD